MTRKKDEINKDSGNTEEFSNLKQQSQPRELKMCIDEYVVFKGLNYFWASLLKRDYNKKWFTKKQWDEKLSKIQST